MGALFLECKWLGISPIPCKVTPPSRIQVIHVSCSVLMVPYAEMKPCILGGEVIGAIE